MWKLVVLACVMALVVIVAMSEENRHAGVRSGAATERPQLPEPEPEPVEPVPTFEALGFGAMPSPEPGEAPPQDSPRLFDHKGLPSSGVTAMVDACMENVPPSVFIDASKLCACQADATQSNVGGAAAFDPKEHSLSVKQVRRCAAYAEGRPVRGDGELPGPFNSRGIALMTYPCWAKQRAAGESPHYGTTFCGCRIDALRSHPGRLYFSPEEKVFCDAVARNWDAKRVHPTPSQIKWLELKSGL